MGVVAKEDCKLTESHIDSSKGHSKQVSPELVSKSIGEKPLF